MRAREMKAALLEEQAKIEKGIATFDAQMKALVARRDGIVTTLAMLDAPAKARKPRTPKAAKPDAPTGELPEPGQE